jgi:FkbM family methyltransferase
MTGATGNIYAGLHEFPDTAFVLHFLRPGDLFADIGANIGSYTLLASGVAGCRTVAFEPDPTTAAALDRNIKLNNLADLVEIRVAAAGEQRGVARFSVGLDTLNRVVSSPNMDAREVPVENLDSAFDYGAPILMKMDVEGYEAQVLHGAKGLLRAPELRAVLIEDRSSAVVQMLESAGMTEFSYDAFSHNLVPAGKIVMANALFLRDHEFVMERISTARPVRVLGQSL